MVIAMTDKTVKDYVFHYTLWSDGTKYIGTQCYKDDTNTDRHNVSKIGIAFKDFLKNTGLDDGIIK